MHLLRLKNSYQSAASQVQPIAGDELLGDSYDITEIEDGFFYEVEGKVCHAQAA